MLQTLERTHTFDARVLTADNAAALRTLTGPGGLEEQYQGFVENPDQ